MCKSLELQWFADEMRCLQQITCSIAVSNGSGFDKETHLLKSEPKATEARNACLTVMSQKLMCDKAITTLQIATNYTKLPIRDLAGNSTHIQLPTHIELLVCSFFKFIKAKENSMGVQEKEQL